MIGAILLAPLVLLALDWALWWRIDDAMSGALYPRSPWRLRGRRWLVHALVWGWCMLVAWRNGRPGVSVDDGAGRALLGVGIALLVWWVVALVQDLRAQA